MVDGKQKRFKGQIKVKFYVNVYVNETLWMLQENHEIKQNYWPILVQ